MAQDDARPAIPAEVRREVLVEAGHRCAIQACRSTADVDIHHIIPWADSMDHSPENLIALCPNCHRRADRGDIDRKSLRKYKDVCQGLQRRPVHDEPKTLVKFRPHTIQLLEASNVTSFIEVGAWRFGFVFGEPFADTNYVVTASGNGLVHFRVLAQRTDYIEVEMDASCPDVVRFEFNQ